VIRVLVVDDSAFARKVIREVLSAHPEIEAVDFARDGLEALEKIATLRPDVITLDLVMPTVDGLGVLRALGPDGPRVVVVSVSGASTELGMQALELGAVELVEKPTALATDRLYELGRELTAKVLTAAGATVRPPRPMRPARARVATGSVSCVVIGTSTGGPPAISRLLSALPADLAVPIAIVVHLPREYTEAFARRLDAASPLRVREASPGLPLAGGEVVIARGGVHLTLARARGSELVVTRLDADPGRHLHRPSVDVLFESAAAVYGSHVLGVVLTGMGDDGTAGARAIAEAGGEVITEAASTCIVYGMPRSVVEAGYSAASVPLDDMAARIVEKL